MVAVVGALIAVVVALLGLLGVQHWRNRRHAAQRGLTAAVERAGRVVHDVRGELARTVEEGDRRLADATADALAAAAVDGESPAEYINSLSDD